MVSDSERQAVQLALLVLLASVFFSGFILDLEQFTPVLRRAERLRFSTLTGRGSVARHDELIRLCTDGDAPGAAAVAFDTWHSLDTGETTSTD